jgi:hypothetical protein
MSKTYNAVFRVVTPKATRVIDRFHVMRHAIFALTKPAGASSACGFRVLDSIVVP